MYIYSNTLSFIHLTMIRINKQLISSKFYDNGPLGTDANI